MAYISNFAKNNPNEFNPPKKTIVKQTTPYRKIEATKANIIRGFLPVPKNAAQMIAKTVFGDARMNEESLTDKEKLILWNTIQNAQKRSGVPSGGGTEYQDYGNQGYGTSDQFNDWFNRGKTSFFETIGNSLTNPGYKLASTIGRGRYWQDPNDANTIYYTDVYDWNPNEKNYKGNNAYQLLRNYVRSTEDKDLNEDKNENYRMNFKLTKDDIERIKAGKPPLTTHPEVNFHTPTFKKGGWLTKYSPGGVTGDPNQPYHPITNPEGYKVKLSDVLKVAQKNQQEAADTRTQIKQGHKELPYEKQAREERLRKEAQENSALAQTLGLFTPSGSNNAAGAIGAETFVNMAPGIGIIPASARLATFVNSVGPNNSRKGENIYFSKDKSFGENALGALNFAGDVGMLNMHIPKSTPMPGVRLSGFGRGALEDLTFGKEEVPNTSVFGETFDHPSLSKEKQFIGKAKGRSGITHDIEYENTSEPDKDFKRYFSIQDKNARNNNRSFKFTVSKEKGDPYSQIGDLLFFNDNKASADDQLRMMMSGMPAKVHLPAAGSEKVFSMYSQPLVNTNVARLSSTPGRITVTPTGFYSKLNNAFIPSEGSFLEQAINQFPKIKRSYATLSKNIGVNLGEPKMYLNNIEAQPHHLMDPDIQKQFGNIRSNFGIFYAKPDVFRIEVPDYSVHKHFEKGGMITDPMGQWKYPGMNTRIPGSNITMQGVPYPVLAKASNGMSTMMYPGREYSFPGASHVDEYPMAKNGGAWLNKYQVGGVNIISLLPNSPIIKWATHKPTTKDLVASVADPTGLSNVPFVTESARNMIENPSWKNAGNLFWNALGSIPVIGSEVRDIRNAPKIAKEVSTARKVGRAVGKPVGAVIKTADKVITAPARAVDAGWKAIGFAPAVGQGLLHSNWWNRGERAYEAGLEGVRQGLNAIDPGTQPKGPYVPQQKYGGQNNWLSKYK
jgi:hypothetical protein